MIQGCIFAADFTTYCTLSVAVVVVVVVVAIIAVVVVAVVVVAAAVIAVVVVVVVVVLNFNTSSLFPSLSHLHSIFDLLYSFGL